MPAWKVGLPPPRPRLRPRPRPRPRLLVWERSLRRTWLIVTEDEGESFSFRREVEREEKEAADKLRDKKGTRVDGRGVSN